MAMKRVMLALVLCLAACEEEPEVPPPIDAETLAKIDRGRYLVNHVAICMFCHTPMLPDGSRDITRLYAGVPNFIDTDRANPDVGLIASRNLTNHETGLKNFTDDQIVGAFRDGMKLDGTGMVVSVHPWWIYKNMTDDDAYAIVAFLRTLTPIDSATPLTQAPWTLMPPRAPIDLGAVPMPQGLSGGDLDSAMRGRYLVNAIGLCHNCHTPLAMGDLDRAKLLGGGAAIRKEQLYGSAPNFPATIFGANLTPDATGIAGWSMDDVRTVFRFGRDKAGKCVCAPTHGGPNAQYAGLTDADLDDVARFLLAQPAISNVAKPSECEAPGFCAP
jgi:mono/diheme cytochrome c family protein/cytochrome c553